MVNFKHVVIDPKTTSVDCGHDVMRELSCTVPDKFTFSFVVNTRFSCFLVTAKMASAITCILTVWPKI